MWARLDDALIDHRKLYTAGELIGDNGPAIAIGFYAICLMWTNKHLTDGRDPDRDGPKVSDTSNDPVAVADALTSAGLLERNGDRVRDPQLRRLGQPDRRRA